MRGASDGAGAARPVPDRRYPEREWEQLVRRIAVIGLGRFGTTLARALNRLGAEVLALDRDPEKVGDLWMDQVTAAFLIGAGPKWAISMSAVNVSSVVQVRFAIRRRGTVSLQ